MERKPLPEYVKFFKLNRVAGLLNIQSDKLYNNFRGHYNSLHINGDADKIAKLLINPVKQLFERLGYNVSFEKSDKKK